MKQDYKCVDKIETYSGLNRLVHIVCVYNVTLVPSVQTVSAVLYSGTFNGSLATTVVLNLPCCLFTIYERNLQNLEHFPKSYHNYSHDTTL